MREPLDVLCEDYSVVIAYVVSAARAGDAAGVVQAVARAGPLLSDVVCGGSKSP
jgi:ribosomal protein L7Ae-like RNA K-turn-binding protein